MMTDLKAEAKELGLKRADIRALYCELRERDTLAREWKWAIRSDAFDRSGYGRSFKSVYRRAFADGDMTQIPCFDMLAQELSWEHPELTRDGDPATALWELLSEPVDRLPAAADTYRETIDLLADGYVARADTVVPF